MTASMIAGERITGWLQLETANHASLAPKCRNRRRFKQLYRRISVAIYGNPISTAARFGRVTTVTSRARPGRAD